MAVTRNESVVDEWLEDDRLVLLEAWARDGASLQDIADNIGISRTTLVKWRDKFPEIRNAIKSGREVVDYKVENALLKSALGFTTKEIKVTIGKQVKNGKTFQITKETTTKEIAPNVTACLAWLNNRKPDSWKRNRDNVVELEEEDNDLKITIIRGNKKENDEEEINKGVILSKKDKNETEEDKDFWPDDWEDEEDE